MKGRQIRYSAAELDWIKANCALPRRELLADFAVRFGRHEVTLEQIKALCTRKGWKTGRTGCFEKGQTSHNKGRKGCCAPGSEKGWFKKGSRTGRANEIYKPVGTERMTKEGYLERKINDDLPLKCRWRAIHLINWEAKNGPVPEGHALKCLDGNRQNTDANNWEPVSRSMLPRLSAAKRGINYDTAPPELRPALLATAKLEQAIREAAQ